MKLTKNGLWAQGFLVLFLFLYSLQSFSKTIVIADIDDTLKKANSVGTFPEQAYHFLKKIPYFEMRDLLNEIKDHDNDTTNPVAFYYVSAAYEFTFDAQEWIHQYHFPNGVSTLKSFKNKESTYDFKHAVIKKILELEAHALDVKSGETLHVLMFGDNAQADAVVYTDLTREMNLESQIYIRDVRTEATFFDSSLAVKKIPSVKYYLSEVELFKNPELDFVSNALKLRALNSYHKKELIPEYTFVTLSRRLESLYKDDTRAHNDATKFWNDYYNRF